jgi:hypothetical protein
MGLFWLALQRSEAIDNIVAIFGLWSRASRLTTLRTRVGHARVSRHVSTAAIVTAMNTNVDHAKVGESLPHAMAKDRAPQTTVNTAIERRRAT